LPIDLKELKAVIKGYKWVSSGETRDLLQDSYNLLQEKENYSQKSIDFNKGFILGL